MALELTFGTIFGFTIFVFVVLTFGIGLLIFTIYVNCIKKPSSKDKDLEDNGHIKNEPNGATWTNPIIEMEEVTEEEERNNDKADILQEEAVDPHPYRDYDENDHVEEEVSENITYEATESYEDQTTEQFFPLPVEVLQIDSGDDNNVEQESETEESKEEEDVETEERPITPEPPKEEFRETPGYATVDDVARGDNSQPKPRVGKLSARISAFEDQFKEASLVRASRKQELEGIQSKVVSNLVTEYEESDSVLLGRQMSDDPALLLSQNTSNSARRNPSFNPHQQQHSLNNNNNGGPSSHVVANSSEEQINRQSHVDEDTGEPLYSQPDLTKKFSRRSNRDSGVPAVVPDDAASNDGTEGDLPSPMLPPKTPDL